MRLRRSGKIQLVAQATTDPLTGLSNRTGFGQRLADALSAAGRPALATVLVYLDIDDFKSINDRYGHGVGDEVLQTVAKRLRAAARSEDTVARLGGDEFALICDGVGGRAAAVVARLRESLAAPMTTSAGQLLVGVSMGAHQALPGDMPRAALASADRLMYQDKQPRRR